MAQSFRDVASALRGIDIGWDTGPNRLKFYAVTAGTPATMGSMDPATGNWGFGGNENVIYVDNANSRSYFGASSQSGALTNQSQMVATGRSCLLLQRTETGSQTLARFVYSDNSVVGSISRDATTTTYATTSDGRLKSVLGELSSGGVIDRLAAYGFRWTASGELSAGLIAQEVHRLVPEAVCVGSDIGPGEEGFEPWQLDYSKLVPYLWAEVRELRRRIGEVR